MTADKPTPVVPNLRFPEFRDAPEWSTPCGDTLFDSVNNRRAAPGLPVLAITQEHGAIPRDQIDYHVSVTAESVASYKEVCEGDFIISLRSFQGGIEYSRYHGICSPAYVILRRKGGGNDHFFRHLFKSERFIQQLTRNIEGLRDGKMISYAQFSEQLLPVPEPPEQQKISDCLGSLDDLIAAEGRKLEALRQHKQGLMQQLFPQPDETVPRLRFPEFEDAPEWEEERLGNLVAIVSGKSPSQYALFAQGDCAFVKVEDLNNCSKYQVDAREYCNDVRDAVPSGSILFPKRGAAIENNKIRITASEILIDTNLMALTPCNTAATEFLYYYLVRVGLAQIADVSSIPQINNKHIIPYRVLAPSESEQHRIADCLAMLDARLAAQVQKINALKTHKQGLLQQLFPSLETE